MGNRPWWGAVGIAVIGVGAWLLATDVPFWNTLWFPFAWIGSLLVLDAVICGLQGHSFLRGRRRELGAMLFWSVPFWCLFEAYNLRIQNWYYVFLPHSEIVQGVFAFVAFATVLPACFFGAELFRALGWFEQIRWRPLPVTRGLEGGILLFGVACILLPLVTPRWAFWMVWGATLFVPDVINRRLGAPSLLADLEAGKPARTLRLLAGGFLAGGVWEGLNFWARAKWIYTVPGFEALKLFEMPLLGFVGFPVLALEAFAGYALFCHWARGGRHWEDPHATGAVRNGRLFASVLVFSALTNVLTLDPIVQARRPLIEDLVGLDEGAISQLADVGVYSPEQLVRYIEAGGEGFDAPYFHANLALHKGMGTTLATALQARGIETVAALAEEDPAELWERLGDLECPPRLAQVGVWIRAARINGQRRR